MTDSHVIENTRTRPIIYIDMDNTIVDFDSGVQKLKTRGEYNENLEADEQPEIFALMDPIPGSIEAIHWLHQYFDLFVLSTSPWNNRNAPSHKLEWIKQHFGDAEGSVFYKRVILSHKKHLNDGDLLIDDRHVAGFKGTHLHFDKATMTWDEVATLVIQHFDPAHPHQIEPCQGCQPNS